MPSSKKTGKRTHVTKSKKEGASHSPSSSPPKKEIIFNRNGKVYSQKLREYIKEVFDLHSLPRYILEGSPEDIKRKSSKKKVNDAGIEKN